MSQVKKTTRKVELDSTQEINNVNDIQVNEPSFVEPKSVAPEQPKKELPKKEKWEVKDRVYVLSGKHTPLTFSIPSRHSKRFPLLWFDNELGEQLELRYATNQNSPFVREQKGEVTLGHIIFRDGVLNVPKEKQNLQKLLSLYHPALNKKYREFDPVKIAVNDLEDLELELEAMQLAKEMDVDQAEAILRVEVGSRVSKMTSKELKRDLLLFAKRDPELFIELANDENIELRNVAVKAVEKNIIILSPDQRTFMWGTTNRKLMTVPFDENPYSAMAAYFKTDEGIEIYRSVVKKLE
jgi:hypothetical protein